MAKTKLNGTITLEKTDRQTVKGAGPFGMAGLAWTTAPKPGTYAEYRRMRGHPTVAMARAAALAPIKAAEWGYEEGEGAPAGALDLIQTVMMELRSVIVTEATRALDYGWQPFEVVWREQAGAIVVGKLKPLLPDMTEPLIDARTGVYCGLRQDKVTVPAPNTWVYTYDGEAGDIFGRSRHENIREWGFPQWVHLSDKLQRFATKSAGIITQVHYPPGEGTSEAGSNIENDEAAKRLIRQITDAGSVAIPTTFPGWAMDLLRAGANINDLISWRISFLQAGPPHYQEIVTAMRYQDSLMMRGWLVPERSVIEATTAGSRADSGTAADLSLLVAQETLDDLLRNVNKGIVDPILVRNFGRAAAGTVKVIAAPLASEVRAWLRDLLKQVLVQPANVDLLMTWLDLDAVFDQAGVPKALDTIEPVERAVPGAPPPEPLAASLAGLYRGINKKRAIRMAFDPSQPRDEEGQWTDTGGGGGVGTPPYDEPDKSFNDAVYKDITRAQSKALNKDQKRARKLYVTTDNDQDLNATLRGISGEQLTDESKFMVKNMDSAFESDSAKLKTDVVVYRGSSVDAFKGAKVGSLYRDKGYVSTSLDPVDAAVFIRNEMGEDEASSGGAVAIIRASKGTRVLSGGGMGELIFPRQSRFRVTKIVKPNKGDSRTYFFLDHTL